MKWAKSWTAFFIYWRINSESFFPPSLSSLVWMIESTSAPSVKMGFLIVSRRFFSQRSGSAVASPPDNPELTDVANKSYSLDKRMNFILLCQQCGDAALLCYYTVNILDTVRQHWSHDLPQMCPFPRCVCADVHSVRLSPAELRIRESGNVLISNHFIPNRSWIKRSEARSLSRWFLWAFWSCLGRVGWYLLLWNWTCWESCTRYLRSLIETCWRFSDGFTCNEENRISDRNTSSSTLGGDRRLFRGLIYYVAWLKTGIG